MTAAVTWLPTDKHCTVGTVCCCLNMCCRVAVCVECNAGSAMCTCSHGHMSVYTCCNMLHEDAHGSCMSVQSAVHMRFHQDARA